MKWIFVISFLCIQLMAFSQDEISPISAKTDKLSYTIGDTIYIHIESQGLFRLSTTGDCNGTLMLPGFIKEVDGEWVEPEARRQLCCGLPYSQAMMQADMSINLSQAGRYKAVVFTGGSYVLSNVFEVLDN